MSNDLSSKTTCLILDESLEKDLASLNREMETIKLECDRLIQNNEKNKIKNSNFPLLEYQKPFVSNLQTQNIITENQINNNFSSFQFDLKNLANEKQKKQQCDYNLLKNYPTLINEQINNNKICELNQKNLIKSNQNHLINNNNKTPFSVNCSSVVFVEETSSSAYNTGGDSCRSTPMKYTEQYNNNKNNLDNNNFNLKSNITSRPKNLDISMINSNSKTTKINLSIQKTPTDLSSPENFYHTIDTPTPSTVVPTASKIKAVNIKTINNPVQFR